MSARRPEECNVLLNQAIMRGDIDTAMTFYEPNATFVLDSGEVATGEAAIREVIQSYEALKPDLNLDVNTALLNGDGDLALTSAVWHFTGVDAEGNPVADSGKSVEVVRRQADGTWRIVIDHPHGAG